VALQGAGVDTLIIAATSKPAAQAIRKVYDLGWTPERYLFFGAASIAQTLKPAGIEKCKGLITVGYIKDPTVPRWQDDPGFKEWEDFATKYMSPTDVREQLAVYGFTTAATMVHVLEQCGDELSRENILRQALAIKDLELPMLLPGVKINTSPEINGNNQKAQELANEQGMKVAQNVAAGVVGLVIWPVWFGMDFKNAAGQDAANLQARQEYLTQLAVQRCAPGH
jgi:branched-chain amino acid transport system substrate-binding protein